MGNGLDWHVRNKTRLAADPVDRFRRLKPKEVEVKAKTTQAVVDPLREVALKAWLTKILADSALVDEIKTASGPEDALEIVKGGVAVLLGWSTPFGEQKRRDALELMNRVRKGQLE